MTSADVRAESRTGASISIFHGAVRFTLELVLLAGYFYWGWKLENGGLTGAALGLLFAALAAALWGVFGAKEDRSRGKAVVPVPGWTRVALEFAIIGVCAAGIWTSW